MTIRQDLAGRVALITGAGNGIGRETANQIAARGAIVGINDLKPEFVEATVAEHPRRGRAGLRRRPERLHPRRHPVGRRAGP